MTDILCTWSHVLVYSLFILEWGWESRRLEPPTIPSHRLQSRSQAKPTKATPHRTRSWLQFYRSRPKPRRLLQLLHNNISLPSRTGIFNVKPKMSFIGIWHCVSISSLSFFYYNPGFFCALALPYYDRKVATIPAHWAQLPAQLPTQLSTQLPTQLLTIICWT